MNGSSNQERVSSFDQAEPEPPQIKEEPEELCIDQEEERLVQTEELDHHHRQRNIIRVSDVTLQSTGIKMLLF